MTFKEYSLGGLVLVGSLMLASAASASTTITVNGTDDIFAAGLSSPPSSTSGGGTLPTGFGVTGGETLKITASGTVSCCLGSSTPSTGPDGFTPNPFSPGGSTITNSTGSGVGTYSNPTSAFALAGVFTGGSLTETPFTVGSNDTVVVPVGATELYLGFADASGFNGPSGYYGDNGGTLSATISAVPEPGIWAMMLAGVAMMGAALRFNRRKGPAAISV